ncbi:membrane protein [Burkholderiaceae bacterium 16]|nr:membrane protein [Burkholderiaceae bacterium 16]
MKKRLSSRLSTIVVAAIALLGSVAAAPAMAAPDETQGNWMVRLRATYLDMADKSDPIGGVGASDRITVNNKWIPELDVTYFFTPHIAAELVLTVPQKQNVYLDGNKIGSFTHLPPTLLVQYHFIPNGTFRPYVGAGLNFTRIWGADIANNSLSLDSWSVAPALQIGMDYKLTKNWFLNADIKKVWLSSDVKAAGVKVSNVSLDPWLFSMGVGYRF